MPCPLCRFVTEMRGGRKIESLATNGYVFEIQRMINSLAKVDVIKTNSKLTSESNR